MSDYNKEYYDKHSDEIRRKRKEYYKKNKKKIRAYALDYYHKNKEEIQASRRSVNTHKQFRAYIRKLLKEYEESQITKQK